MHALNSLSPQQEQELQFQLQQQFQRQLEQQQQQQQQQHQQEEFVESGSSVALPPLLRFLIVDDDQFNSTVLRMGLQWAGKQTGEHAAWQVDMCPTGEAALERHQNDHYDVLILDQNLEGGGGALTGSDVVSMLRQEGDQAIVIISSGNCSRRDIDFYMSMGANHCWPKPYPSQEDMLSDLFFLLRQQETSLTRARSADTDGDAFISR